jgi:beta-galactosidase
MVGPEFADACDQLGVLLWSENNFWGGFGGGPGGWSYSGSYPSTSTDYDKYDANVLTSLTDMIHIHRNHPSIIAWSTGNEDFFNGGGPADRVVALLKKKVALVHQLDPNELLRSLRTRRQQPAVFLEDGKFLLARAS